MKKLLYILLFVPLALFGQDNYSLSFDGVDDWLEFQSIDLTGSPFTIEGWIKVPLVTHDWQTNVVDQYAVHVGGSDRWGIYIGGAQEDGFKGQLYACTFGICDGPQIDDNTWHNFAFVRDGSGLTKMFLDGVLVNSGECPIDYNLNSSIPLRINGGLHQNPDDGSIGRFMDFSLANLNISLNAKYSSTYDVCDFSENTNSILNIEFNGGPGDTVYDISGNGNHGVVNGATFSEDFPEESCSILDQLNQSFDAWNVSIDLSSGWNMFGYGCPSSIDITEGLSNHTESISITKDNNGNVYMPEFSFNGIGDLTPGFGYQIKLTEAIEGFSLCDWYVNDIPEDNIVSLQDSLDLINSQIGCTDSLACNFDINYLFENGSCEYAEHYYDCDGNQLPQYQVGDLALGGIIFYVDETGYHGLIAAPNDLEGGFPWGCEGQSINGARYTDINTGYFNSQDIIGFCDEEGTAARACDSYENDGYNDWYLPSIEELVEMNYSIGLLSQIGNIAQFISTTNAPSHISSTEHSANTVYSYQTEFDNPNNNRSKSSSIRVRPIRSF